jgi:uncharacterized protein (TIGR03083 family)
LSSTFSTTSLPATSADLVGVGGCERGYVCHAGAVPSSLAFDEHLAALETAGNRLVATAEAAGMDAPVPTCPAWHADALVAHQAMVHRWATAHVRGDDPTGVPNQTDIRTAVADLSGYYREGLAALTTALRAASPDLEAMTFLNDAGRPREFWSRRQAHETTIHMVDALAAKLGRPPTAGEAEIERPLAADGIDELVRGFFTRGRSRLYDGTEYTVAVTPRDIGRRWVLHVAERLTVEPGDGADDETDAMISGSAAELYLALWNRGDHVDVAGREDLLDRWRATQRVKWS